MRLGAHDAGAAPEGFPDGAARLFVRPSDVTLLPVGGAPDGGAQPRTSPQAVLPGRVVDLIWGSRGMRAIVAVDGVAQPLEVEASKDAPVTLGEAVVLGLSQVTLFR